MGWLLIALALHAGDAPSAPVLLPQSEPKLEEAPRPPPTPNPTPRNSRPVSAEELAEKTRVRLWEIDVELAALSARPTSRDVFLSTERRLAPWFLIGGGPLLVLGAFTPMLAGLHETGDKATSTALLSGAGVLVGIAAVNLLICLGVLIDHWIGEADGAPKRQARIAELEAEQVALRRAPVTVPSPAVPPPKGAFDDAPLADTPPVMLEEVRCAYPDAARRAAVEGTVRVRIEVDENGLVTGLELLSGPGFGLNEAALEAIAKFKFRPATKDGKPVRATMAYNYAFQLD